MPPLAKIVNLEAPYIATNDRAYVVSAQDGGFPGLKWHVPREMSGVWARPIKLLDGWWLRVAGESWCAHEYDLPDGLRLERRACAKVRRPRRWVRPVGAARDGRPRRVDGPRLQVDRASQRRRGDRSRRCQLAHGCRFHPGILPAGPRDGLALWNLKAACYTALLAWSRLEIPEPSITHAWDWITCDYDWLMHEVALWGRGLGAGTQDYVWWFDCNADYALCGCLALGQHDSAVETFDLLRWLSVAANGESGRVIYECTTWNCASNPGNTQETPHFVRAVWDAFLWTGDLAFLRRTYAFCNRSVLEWTLGETCSNSKVLPYGYGLIEVEELRKFHDGTFPDAPIALVEAQGYTYEARMAEAVALRSIGDESAALREEQKAQELSERFNQNFWLPDERFFAQALDAGKWVIPAVMSNDGDALWAGIVADDWAAVVTEQLLFANMSSGWGMLNYHNGLVWPHGAAIVAAGLRRYGHRRGTATLLAQVAAATAGYADVRLPELYVGLPRVEAERGPVPYQVSYSPQAWSTASVFLMPQSALGLHADAHAAAIQLCPVFPPGLHRINLSRLRVGAVIGDVEVDVIADGNYRVTATADGPSSSQLPTSDMAGAISVH